VRNFSHFLALAQALDGTATSPYDAASAGKKTILDAMQRVGRIQIVLAAGQAVTITDSDAGTYTVTNPAAFPSLIHEVKIINGHKNVKLSGSGTIGVVVLAD
jgi:hypothetical protein